VALKEYNDARYRSSDIGMPVSHNLHHSDIHQRDKVVVATLKKHNGPSYRSSDIGIVHNLSPRSLVCIYLGGKVGFVALKEHNDPGYCSSNIGKDQEEELLYNK
jgi:hypothetical protein